MENRVRVYLPQEPLKRNEQGDLVPVHDLTPALEFGELVVLLKYGPVMVDPSPMVDSLMHKMRKFGDADYVLGIGDPAAIAAAVMVASYYNFGRVKLLRWDRKLRAYLPIQLDVNERKTDGNHD